jgi:hypothetical protein
MHRNATCLPLSQGKSRKYLQPRPLTAVDVRPLLNRPSSSRGFNCPIVSTAPRIPPSYCMGTLQSADPQTHSWHGSSALCHQCQVVHAFCAWICAASSLIRPSDLDLHGYLVHSAPGVSFGEVFAHTGCCLSYRLQWPPGVLRWHYRSPSPARLGPSARSLVTTSACNEEEEGKWRGRARSCRTCFAFAAACAWRALLSVEARQAPRVLRAALSRLATFEYPYEHVAMLFRCIAAADSLREPFRDRSLEFQKYAHVGSSRGHCSSYSIERVSGR